MVNSRDNATQRRNKKDVVYFDPHEAETLDELPPEAPRRRSRPLEDALAKIKADPRLHARWLEIATYGKGNGASSARQVLIDRHGLPHVEGWEIATRKRDDGRVGLWVRYDTGNIVDGAAEQWAKKRAKKLQEDRAKKLQAEQAKKREQERKKKLQADRERKARREPAASSPVPAVQHGRREAAVPTPR